MTKNTSETDKKYRGMGKKNVRVLLEYLKKINDPKRTDRTN